MRTILGARSARVEPFPSGEPTCRVLLEDAVKTALTVARGVGRIVEHGPREGSRDARFQLAVAIGAQLEQAELLAYCEMRASNSPSR